MRGARPAAIMETHLVRRGIVYIRQSTKGQVLVNTGSTEYQRGQAGFLLSWGWPEAQVEVIDQDLGLSGTSAEHRSGYQRMLDAIEKGVAGIICVADVMRGGRDALEWYRLLDLCLVFDVLVAVDGRVYDPKDPSDLLTARLLATLGEHDNSTRRKTLMDGRATLARRGQTVTFPPGGYLRKEDGSWIKDPEPAAQAAIETVFREFLRQRSCAKTVRALKALGVELPTRRGNMPLTWSTAGVKRIYHLLTNPAYRGDYVFRRRVADRRCGKNAKGQIKSRPATPDEIITKPNHHEPYVDAQTWEEIQAIMKLNGPGENRRNLCPGAALLQGFIYCGMHWDRSMAALGKPKRRDGGQSHRYQCVGDYFSGGEACRCVSGRLDTPVVEAALARLSIPRLETIRAAVKAARADRTAEQRRREIELFRARRDADDLERRYLGVDDENLDAKRRLEKKFNEALKNVKRLEQAARLPAKPPAEIAAVIEELTVLCRDLRALFYAPTTTNVDRKQLLRLLIARVRVIEKTAEMVRAEIHWADGGEPTVVSIIRERYAGTVVYRLADEGLSAEAIAARLNAAGFPTKTGVPWSVDIVKQRLARRRRRTRRQSKA